MKALLLIATFLVSSIALAKTTDQRKPAHDAKSYTYTSEEKMASAEMCKEEMQTLLNGKFQKQNLSFQVIDQSDWGIKKGSTPSNPAGSEAGEAYYRSGVCYINLF